MFWCWCFHYELFHIICWITHRKCYNSDCNNGPDNKQPGWRQKNDSTTTKNSSTVNPSRKWAWATVFKKCKANRSTNSIPNADKDSAKQIYAFRYIVVRCRCFVQLKIMTTQNWTCIMQCVENERHCCIYLICFFFHFFPFSFGFFAIKNMCISRSRWNCSVKLPRYRHVKLKMNKNMRTRTKKKTDRIK